MDMRAFVVYTVLIWNSLVIAAQPELPTKVELDVTSGDINIQWDSVIGQNYQVEKSLTLEAGSWSQLGQGRAGSGSRQNLTDIGAATEPKSFYRIGCSVESMPHVQNWPSHNPTRTLLGVTFPANPRWSAGSMKQFPARAKSAAFDLVCSKPSSSAITLFEQTQDDNPKQIFMRVWPPIAYQGYDDSAGSKLSGLPFESTGTTTNGSAVFAGHWLYMGGRAELTAEATSTTTMLYASNLAAFPEVDPETGSYAVILDSADAWNTAEHVLIQSVNISEGTISIAPSGRGYKSTARARSVGSIVQMHQLMAGTDARGWGWNHATSCPVDGAGFKLNHIMAKIDASTFG